MSTHDPILEETQPAPGFSTPPNHVRFAAKKLFGPSGALLDGAVAVVEPGGGGPVEPHVHPGRDHIFIVVEGEARVDWEGESRIVRQNESIRVPGTVRHAVWNNSVDRPAVMIGLTVAPVAAEIDLAHVRNDPSLRFHAALGLREEGTQWTRGHTVRVSLQAVPAGAPAAASVTP